VVFLAATAFLGVMWYISNKSLIAVERDLSATRGELQSTQQDLTSTKAHLQSTQQDLTSTRAQLQFAQQDLTSTTAQLKSTQQQLAATTAQLASATSRVTELTSGPLPLVVQQIASFESTGFLGSGPRMMVITATVANRGAGGIVKLTATATWPGGSRTGIAEMYFLQGQEQAMRVELLGVPTNATYSVFAAAK
jgi:multidrug efflux pump subunit AcrA (membrane-fusion protein)